MGNEEGSTPPEKKQEFFCSLQTRRSNLRRAQNKQSFDAVAFPGQQLEFSWDGSWKLLNF